MTGWGYSANVPKQTKFHDHPELLGMPEVRKLWQTEGLFSDHYLKARLKNNDWWPSDAEAQPTFQFCKELYEKRAFALRKYDNEMGVRQEFIDKILERLGFAWSDNLRLPETKQDLEPDYILYPNNETKESVLNKSVADRYRAGVGILEAKRFGHPLSQISKHQQRYPHQQIRDYLQESDSIVWGILTNGQVWRLYCRDSKASHYFALNFEVALNSLEDFKIFLVLFSSAAFTRDAQGKCRLDQVRENALATQAELEADLRERIFTIVEILANGFAERPENKIADADLPRLYENCLIFLYRLLFILYAEGRLLLPVEPKSRKYYKQLSLARLLVPLKSFTEYDSQTQTRFYRDIHALCLVINGTDKKANDEFRVPRYNGGLFDPDRYPLLKEWAVADAVLADVLRQLMFTPEKRGQKFVPFESVDYADLSVQQLGSIYEGLLEHHFVREGGKLVLKTDKAERKATGTYYTPDYVVKYIVEQTITPLLQEIEQREPVKSARAAGKQDNSFASEALKLNICDPAMGSGHFLVEATTFLADQIVYHPTTKFQAEFVKGESQEETEIAYWRRRVVEACIYGVDLNPLAVELAKLSLWLTTISSDQPLNFLDHHLCRGNSLIGARLEDLSHVPDKKRKTTDGLKLSWKITENLRASLTKAVQMVHNIEGAASASVSDVKNKEKLWLQSVCPALLPFRTVANLWAACFFGNELPQKDYEALIELLDIHPDKIRPWQNPAEFQAIVMEAVKKGSVKLAGREFDINQLKNLCAFLFRSERSATERRFFHWELEFPEVFFNDDGTAREQPGFDAIIGNPPYVRTHGLSAAEKEFYWLRFTSFAAKSDIYVCFMHLLTDLLRNGGLSSFIVSKGWLFLDSFQKIRTQVLDTCAIKNLSELGPGVFRGVGVETMVFLFLREREAARRETNLVSVGRSVEGQIPKSQRQIAQQEFHQTHRHVFDLSIADDGAAVKRKVVALSERLGEIATIDFGLKTGDDSKFLKRAQTTEQDKPLLRGDDVFRYGFEFKGEFVWYMPDRMRQHRNTARPGEPARFECPKILVKDTSAKLGAAFDSENHYVKDVLIVHHLKEVSALFILPLINSTLLSWFYRTTFPTIHVQRSELSEFPIRKVRFTTPAAKRTTLLAKAETLYKRAGADSDPAPLLAFVEEQLSAKPERADVVHDLLAFLAEQMTTLNRDKRTTAKQFLTDLKDFYGVDTHALKPKTKLDKFWELEAAEVFAHFRANKLRLQDSDEEKLRTRFQTAKDKLVPLESSLAFTDDLIDEIVYRLYGLTAEEIKIVEAAAAAH